MSRYTGYSSSSSSFRSSDRTPPSNDVKVPLVVPRAHKLHERDDHDIVLLLMAHAADTSVRHVVNVMGKIEGCKLPSERVKAIQYEISRQVRFLRDQVRPETVREHDE